MSIPSLEEENILMLPFSMTMEVELVILCWSVITTAHDSISPSSLSVKEKFSFLCKEVIYFSKNLNYIQCNYNNI